MSNEQLTFIEADPNWLSVGSPAQFHFLSRWNLCCFTIKGLSLQRPCPFAFVNGPVAEQKRVENRVWPAPTKMIGHFLALHASQTYSKSYQEWIAGRMNLAVPGRSDSPASEIFAVCRIVGYTTSVDDPQIPQAQRKWFLGPYAWLLDSFVALNKPVPCIGARKLWSFNSRPDALEALRRSYQNALADL